MTLTVYAIRLKVARAIGTYIILLCASIFSCNILYACALRTIAMGGGYVPFTYLFIIAYLTGSDRNFCTATGTGFIAVFFCLASVVIQIRHRPTSAPALKQSYRHNDGGYRHKYGIPGRQNTLHSPIANSRPPTTVNTRKAKFFFVIFFILHDLRLFCCVMDYTAQLFAFYLNFV